MSVVPVVSFIFGTNISRPAIGVSPDVCWIILIIRSMNLNTDTILFVCHFQLFDAAGGCLVAARLLMSVDSDGRMLHGVAPLHGGSIAAMVLAQ